MNSNINLETCKCFVSSFIFLYGTHLEGILYFHSTCKFRQWIFGNEKHLLISWTKFSNLPKRLFPIPHHKHYKWKSHFTFIILNDIYPHEKIKQCVTNINRCLTDNQTNINWYLTITDWKMYRLCLLISVKHWFQPFILVNIGLYWFTQFSNLVRFNQYLTISNQFLPIHYCFIWFV